MSACRRGCLWGPSNYVKFESMNNSTLRFDVGHLLAKARSKLNNQVSGVTIKLPFISFSVKPDDVEKQAAREIVIQLADRRVLNAFECCDDCIDRALNSLQDIRKLLLEKQLVLSKSTDSSLFLVTDLMLIAIRQFLTFIERLNSESAVILPDRKYKNQEAYFAALEVLRAHLYQCLVQVSIIADVQTPAFTASMRYPEDWQIESYVDPQVQRQISG